MRGSYNKVKDQLKGYFAILFFIILGILIFIFVFIATGVKSFVGLFKKAGPQIMKPQPVVVKMERKEYMEGNPNLNVLFFGAKNSGCTTAARRLVFDSENAENIPSNRENQGKTEFERYCYYKDCCSYCE